ncbi:CRISPR-associated helicase Cas3' [Streptomyces sp. N35]|uniref:CRISPR-associated helicase Cas3' n=1 Tax=Streptomyces sp. N35 TaxID=2795730 RepID=UPI0018F687A2|nr:CRISPR-associated helicase Cas3' [Streptomyces sp. N35]
MWGKTDRYGRSREQGGPLWNPLLAHCLDSAAVCGELFDHYLATPVRERLVEAFGGGCAPTARRVLMLLTAVHDMPGKVHPGFQRRFVDGSDSNDPELLAAGRNWERAARAAGLPLERTGRPAPPHAHLTARYLPALLGCRCADCVDPTPGGPTDPPRYEGLHTIAALLGGHHGHFPTDTQILDATCRLAEPWLQAQVELLHELARLLRLDLKTLPDLIRPARPAVLPLMAGLVVHSDWLASDESRFTYRRLKTTTDQWWAASRRQASHAVRALHLKRWQPWPDAMWPDLFPGTPQPRPAQRAVIRHAPQRPMMAIVESTTGSGKTESALWLAHQLTVQCGYHGFYLAQATRAASDQLVRRAGTFLRHALADTERANLALVHGTASISAVSDELARGLDDGPLSLAAAVNLTTCDDPTSGSARAVLDRWYLESGRGLLSPFGVGTVDQIVLAAQRSRHWFLRLYGLANKVVIIDEAHAYELFQQHLLGEAIGWLADAGASVIILSATLPNSTRHELIEAWCAGHRSTPSEQTATGPITFVDASGTVATHTPVPDPTDTTPPARTRLLLKADPGPHALAEHLLTTHPRGITGVIRNRVVSATALYRAVADIADAHGWNVREDVLLLHARFTERDRARHQQRLEHLLGPHPDPELRGHQANPARPERFLLIGTQVLEQSLDYCLDHLYSDLAPIDLLLQRRGRLWRHLANRLHLAGSDASPLMRVLFTPGAGGLPHLMHPGGRPIDAYAPYLQAATWHALNQRRSPMDRDEPILLTTPDDTHPLLQTVYAPTPPPGDEAVHTLLSATFTQWQAALAEHLHQADQRSLAPYAKGAPVGVEDLASGWLNGTADDPDRPTHLIARSRLGAPSIDIVCLYQHPAHGRTWDRDGTVPADLNVYHPRREAEAHRRQQREILLNTVRVPAHWFHGTNALPAPPSWTIPSPGALARHPVLLLTPEGLPHDPAEERLAHLTYTPSTGLSR